MKVEKRINIPEIIKEFENRAMLTLSQENWNAMYEMISLFEEQQIQKALSYLTPKSPWE